MKKVVYRLCSAFLAVLILSVAVVPVCATDDYTSTGSFWQNVARKKWLSGFLGSSLIGWVCDDVCSESSDKKHHGSLKSYDQNPDKSYTAICDFCSAEFPVYDADLSAAYDDYVETLPAQGYNSDGKLHLTPVHDYCYISCDEGSVANNSVYRYCEHYSGSLSSMDKVYPSGSTGEDKHYLFRLDCASSSITLTPLSGKTTFSYRTGRSVGFYFYFSAIAPVDGYYSVSSGPACSVDFLASDGRYSPTISVGETEVAPSFRLKFDNFLQVEKFYSKGDKIPFSFSVHESAGGRFLSVRAFTPVLQVVPVSAPSGDIYNITTRPTSITGGNYGIVGDNGQITKVEDNSTIVNETNNTYYNPATGQTVSITGWSYDYSDRSYKVTLESGDTVSVTYGDENIVIKEGDTVYNIYYLVDGSGSENLPSTCVHDWQETNITPATCTVPGSKLSTCSKCQQVKKDPLPALGHDWQVKQTVTTQYDEEGKLVQQGYTIFECSRCHEQYKSSDGTIPPGGGSGTDPGGDEGETIWDKLGNLIGAIGSGVSGLIEAALGKVLDALLALVEGMMERLKTLFEAVHSIFDELPKLFGGFLDFLVAVFPFLPPELMTILTFGILAVVFIGIIKAVRR